MLKIFIIFKVCYYNFYEFVKIVVHEFENNKYLFAFKFFFLIFFVLFSIWNFNLLIKQNN